MRKTIAKVILMLTWKQMDVIQYYQYCHKHDIDLDLIPDLTEGR